MWQSVYCVPGTMFGIQRSEWVLSGLPHLLQQVSGQIPWSHTVWVKRMACIGVSQEEGFGVSMPPAVPRERHAGARTPYCYVVYLYLPWGTLSLPIALSFYKENMIKHIVGRGKSRLLGPRQSGFQCLRLRGIVWENKMPRTCGS